MTVAPTTLRRSPRAVWRAARAPLAVVAAIVVVAIVASAFVQSTTRGLLDPDAVDPDGSHALATLLRAQGVTVESPRTAADLGAAGPDATVLVPFPDRLSGTQLDAVRAMAGGGADVVLVAPRERVLAALAPGVELLDELPDTEVLSPTCALPAARAAGPAELGGEAFRAPPGAAACYPLPGAGGAPTLVQVRAGAGTVTVLGSSDVLRNGELADEGNAALAMRLLGGHTRLAWFRPVPEGGATVDDDRSFYDLVPAGVTRAAMMLVVAVLFAIGWRARRLGRVVVEPLPVVVRATEAVEGRAQLYRRARARGHATDALRVATRTRLATLVGLPAAGPADPVPDPRLVAAVTARTGRPPAEVESLLYGPAPADDAAMLAVATALDACEAEVRRS